MAPSRPYRSWLMMTLWPALLALLPMVSAQAQPTSRATTRPTSQPMIRTVRPPDVPKAKAPQRAKPGRKTRRKAKKTRRKYNIKQWRQLIGLSRRQLMAALTRRQWRKAEDIAARMATKFRQRYGRIHYKLAQLHYRIGAVWWQHRRPKQADAAFDRSLRQILRLWNVPSVLLMGSIIRRQREIHELLHNHHAVLKRRLVDDRWLHNHRPRDWRLGIWHTHMADLYDATEQSKAALKRRKQALSLIGKNLGTQNLLYVVGLMALSQTQFNLGLLTASLRAVDQAYHIASKSRQPSPFIMGQIHHRRAVILKLKARFAPSLREFHRAERWLRASKRPVNASIESLQHNLALLYTRMGRLGKARRLLRQSLRLGIARLGPDHPSLQTTYNSLASVAAQQRRPKQAIRYYQKALSLLAKSHAPKHQRKAILYMNMASAMANLGQHRKALAYDQKASAIFARGGQQHRRDLAIVTQHIAHRYEDLGQLKLSRQYAQKALILAQTLKEPAPDLRIDIALSLAQIYERMGQQKPSMQLLDQTWRQAWTRLTRQLLSMSHRQRAALLRYRNNVMGRYFSALLRWSHRSASSKPGRPGGLGLRWLLQSQSILTRMYQAQRDIIRHRSETRLRGLFREIGRLSRQISQRSWQLSQRRHITATAIKRWTGDVQRMRQRKEALIQALHLQLGARRYQLGEGRWQRLQSVLSHDAAMVAFVRFRRHRIKQQPHLIDRWQGFRYMAFVLRAQGPPALIDLGPAAPIERSISAYRRWLGRIPPKYLGGPRRAWQKLRRHNDAIIKAIWRPLQPHIKGTTRLWLVPDGALHLVPFGSLRRASGKFLIETTRISYLASGMGLLHTKTKSLKVQKPLVMGAPRFGQKQGVAQQTFVPLPMSLGESQEVARRLNATPILGKAATKATFLAMSQRAPQIIHLATHGFFLPLPGPTKPTLNQEQAVLRSALFRGNGAMLFKDVLLNPLRRAGLAFADANQKPKDGILTAEEIEFLDLRRTSLVVLSACDTGRGQRDIWRGVAGLRSAFLHAGARNVLSSLWKIPDVETRQFMDLFYRHLVKHKAPLWAYQQAQRNTISRLRKRDGIAHPWYWGAFILQGPPGKLSEPTSRPTTKATHRPTTRPDSPKEHKH